MMFTCPNGCEDTLFRVTQTISRVSLIDEDDQWVEDYDEDLVDGSYPTHCHRCFAVAIEAETCPACHFEIDEQGHCHENCEEE